MDSGSPTGGELREELRGDAQTVTDTAKSRIHSEVDARKGTAATQAKNLSSALEGAAGQLDQSPAWLRSAFEQAAQTIQRFADTIEQKDSRQLTRDIQQLARDNPGTFLAGCAVAGFAAARVLKAGVDDNSAMRADAYAEATSAYEPYQPGTSQSSPSAFAGMNDMSAREPAYQGELP